MKIAKRLCPVCHDIIKVAHVDTVKIAHVDNVHDTPRPEDIVDVKVRRYYCTHCKYTIQTLQRPREEELIVDMWLTGHRKHTLTEKVRQYESGKY